MSAESVASIIELAGGKIVGRVRIQKIAFLLQMAGSKGDYSFEYHHYGPYSDELSSSIFWAEAKGLVKEEFAYRATDGARYSVFNLAKDVDLGAKVDGLPVERAREIVDRCESENATVLELAATAVWLRRCENVENWLDELKARKGSKATNDRVARALSLLNDAKIPVELNVPL